MATRRDKKKVRKRATEDKQPTRETRSRRDALIRRLRAVGATSAKEMSGLAHAHRVTVDLDDIEDIVARLEKQGG